MKSTSTTSKCSHDTLRCGTSATGAVMLSDRHKFITQRLFRDGLLNDNERVSFHFVYLPIWTNVGLFWESYMSVWKVGFFFIGGRLRLKCDGTHAESRFSLSAKRSSPFKSAGASVPSTAGSRGVRISGSNSGNTMFRGSMKSTGYPLHSLVSPSLPLPCVTVCHHFSTGHYRRHVCMTSVMIWHCWRLFDVFLTVHRSIDFSKYQISAQLF